MDWDDDELERLVMQVGGLYGNEALAEAYVRAMNAVPPASIASITKVRDLIVDHELPSGTRVVEGPALKFALKAELRQLLTPQL
jgi:hypothetical protein